MKTLFIEAHSSLKIMLPKDMAKLPKKIALFTTIQYIESIDDIKRQLEVAGKKVRLFRPAHAKYDGQLLGCAIQKFRGVDGFLYIGDGLFHPLALSMSNDEVYTYNPKSKHFGKITDEMKTKFHKTKDIALKKYYSSDRIGLLVSTKPGQENLKKALKLKKKLKKTCYLFIFDEINLEKLEDFPFIDCFVNTACPRISYDDFRNAPKPVVDIRDII